MLKRLTMQLLVYLVVDRSMSVDDRLIQFLKEGKDWERRATTIPGVFLLRLPSFKGRSASLAIEVNPVGSSGAATKKRGVVVRSTTELQEINRLLSHPKLIDFAKRIDNVNPDRKPTSGTSAEHDVFEI
jgi:hypothetical protein